MMSANTRTDARAAIDKLTMLYSRLCECAGPQPSVRDANTKDHLPSCPYRREVEAAKSKNAA